MYDQVALIELKFSSKQSQSQSQKQNMHDFSSLQNTDDSFKNFHKTLCIQTNISSSLSKSEGSPTSHFPEAHNPTSIKFCSSLLLTKTRKFSPPDKPKS